MPTVHNYEQIMAWKPGDVRGLIGRHVTVRAAVDDRAFWQDPHHYAGKWEQLGSGLVVSATYRRDSGGYLGQVSYADGGGSGWLSGQPISITETEE